MVNVISCVSSTVAAIGSIGAIAVALYVNYQAHAPRVVVYLEYRGDEASVYLIVKNIGGGVARDVYLSGFDYEMADPAAITILKNGFIEKGIPLLVPGADRMTIINSGQFLSDYGGRIEEVRVTYTKDGFVGTKTKVETFVLDYYSFAGNLHIISNERRTANALEKIEKNLRS